MVGEWDVDALAERLPAGLLAEWKEFYRLEPWGFEWDWLRAGTIAAAVYNANPFRKPNAEPIAPKVFVPDMEALSKPAEPDPNEWKRTKSAVMGYIRSKGGHVPQEAYKVGN